MASSEGEESDSLAKKSNISEINSNLCSHCNRKVVGAMKCTKCSAVLHPSCWKTSNSKNTSSCYHVSVQIPDEISSGSIQLNKLEDDPVKQYLSIQVKLLSELLDEVRSKNLVLLENSELLSDKIKNLESEITRLKNGKQCSSCHSCQPSLSIKVTENKLPTEMVPTPCDDEVLPGKRKISRQTSTSSSSENANMRRQQLLNIPTPEQANINKDNGTNDNNTQEKNANDNSWTTVVNKRNNDKSNFVKTTKRPQSISKNISEKKSRTTTFCTGDVDPSSKIKGAVRKKWIYVGRIKGDDVHAEDIKQYISKLPNHDTIEVKKLPTRGTNSAFSIGIPDDVLLEKLQNPTFWPAGVTLREFNFSNFFRTQRIQQ